MTYWKYLLLALRLGQATATAQPAWPAQPAQLLLTNALVVNPRTQQVQRQCLLVRAGRVQRVSARPPAGYQGQRLDLQGSYLVPALSDMHVHALGNYGPNDYLDKLRPAAAAQHHLYCGVGHILDLFNDEALILAQRNQQRRGELGGAAIYCAGPAFTCTGGHGTEYPGLATRVVNTPAEAQAQVTALAAYRPDVVKVVYDHASSLPTMSQATLAACLATARTLGIPTVVHVGTWTDVEEALRAGASAITHVPLAPLPPAVAELFVASKAYFIPALTAQLDFIGLAACLESDSLAHELTSAGLRRAYLDTAHYDRGTRWLLRWQKPQKPTVLRSVQVLSERGVPILAGTDAGNSGTLQGYSLHRELALLRAAGLSSWQVLAASSTRAGELLHQHWGVEVGDEASFLVMRQSPLADPAALLQFHLLVQQGHVQTRASLRPPRPHPAARP